MAVDIVDLDADSEVKQEKPAAAPPAVDAAAIAREIVARLPKPETPAQEKRQSSKVQEALASMLQEGYDEKAVRAIFNLYVAGEQEKEEKAREKEAHQYLESYNRNCWALADEAIAKFEAAIPAVRDEDIRAVLLNKTNRIFLTGDEYAAEREAGAQSLKLPSKATMQKCAAKAIEQYCKTNGISYREPQLDLRSSIPADTKPKSDDPYHGLTEGDRKRARALATHLKLAPAEAAKRVSSYNRHTA